MNPVLAPTEAESAVIGALLLEPDRLAGVRAILPGPAAFSDRQAAETYGALLATFDAGQPTDSVTLLAALRARGASSDTEAALGEYLEHAVTSANVLAHAQLVLDGWRRRQLLAEADRLRARSADPSQPVRDLVADSCQRLVPIGAGDPTEAPRRLSTLFLDTLQELERTTAAGRRVLGLSTGLDRLDELTDGWQAGTLTILAARPSRGKTSLALTFARLAATVAPVHIVSLEMTDDQLVARLLQAEIGCDLRRLRRDAALHARYARSLYEASAALAALPLAIDRRSRSPGRLRLELLAQQAQRGAPIGLLVIDYLGLMDADTVQQNRDRELGSITKALKALAQDLAVPVLLLCQLNRASDRDNRAPELYDVRDSGNIEQDADDVLMLHWPEGKPDHGPAAVDLYARKVRNGFTGKVPLLFEPWTQRWREAAVEPELGVA